MLQLSSLFHIYNYLQYSEETINNYYYLTLFHFNVFCCFCLDKHGQLLFLGETHFAKGEWAGVYLDESCGKNNGSIDGKAYFSCPDKHGIFIKPNKLTLVHKSSSSSTASAETTDQQRPQTPMQNKSANVRRDSRVPANQTPNFKTPVASQGPNFPATSAG